ncbi:hypothetical protein CYMTET_21952 [Cymbomonas tetramitiformis]|uniref:tRNA-splicing endonuclease subunit Sen54 N-terminal domain-containing protein n=1 Tax=Cymbomonas tetramitiformis TaxID=36881 RepID=A0AAE0G172_9CHLO|nr:hypothetical protein CYMTET_21952 [Cymbomonas tetramitiformis]
MFRSEAMPLKNKEIFKRGGPKKSGPSANEMEEDVLDTKLEVEAKMSVLHSAWSKLPSTTGKKLSVAEWSPSDGLAKVRLLRGNQLSSMGFFQGSQHYLLAEEVMYLMESTR